MIYIMYGTESFIKDQNIKKILSEMDKNSIIKYDLNINNIEEIINEALTVSLFSFKKAIVIYNSDIFTAKKNTIEHNISRFEQYLENPNSNTIMLFITDSEKLDERKKITKLIKNNGQIINCNNCNNHKNVILSLFKDYEINDECISLLIDRVGNNLDIINKEIEKIISFKDDNKKITKEDILNITSKNLQPDLFLFIDNIVSKNIEKSMLIYNDLLIYNEEPIKIIVMLSNQFRLIYQTKLLMQRGYDLTYIANELNIHPYRVKLALEKGRLYTLDTLLYYIEKLADLDYEIKTGQIDKKIGFELFILNV